MIYIYDVLLNWCDVNSVYAFYEWDLNDSIEHIKKISLVKVDSKTMGDLVNNEVKVNQTLLDSLNTKCEVYDQDNIIFLKYAALFTDGARVMAIEFDKNGLSLFKSKMLIDEEGEVLDIAHRINETNIVYKVNKQLVDGDYLTRLEKQIKNCLAKEFKDIYHHHDKQKLKYFYYECFNNNEEQDLDVIYQRLKDSLASVNDNHLKLYNIIKMLYTKKSV